MVGVEPITLFDNRSRVVIRPDLGAGLSAFTFDDEPIFRTAPDGTQQPFELALNLLVPWSNRISGGGFSFEGQFHRLEPNLPGEPFPIHGNGFCERWDVVSQSGQECVLTLFSGVGPYRYEADVVYRLERASLAVTLSVRNTGELALPFGLGLHPWLPRDAATFLRAAARTAQLQDERYLPIDFQPVAERPDWNFTSEKPLPSGWINNAFSGWNGSATITWHKRRLKLDITSVGAAHYIVYSPNAEAAFFCFEPVTHPVDAHNLPGGPLENGLAILKPGQTQRLSCHFKPSRLT
jgi:aldose 1-epimerase